MSITRTYITLIKALTDRQGNWKHTDLQNLGVLQSLHCFWPRDPIFITEWAGSSKDSTKMFPENTRRYQRLILFTVNLDPSTYHRAWSDTVDCGFSKEVILRRDVYLGIEIW